MYSTPLWEPWCRKRCGRHDSSHGWGRVAKRPGCGRASSEPAGPKRPAEAPRRVPAPARHKAKKASPVQGRASLSRAGTGHNRPEPVCRRPVQGSGASSGTRADGGRFRPQGAMNRRVSPGGQGLTNSGLAGVAAAELPPVFGGERLPRSGTERASGRGGLGEGMS